MRSTIETCTELEADLVLWELDVALSCSGLEFVELGVHDSTNSSPTGSELKFVESPPPPIQQIQLVQLIQVRGDGSN